jgi:hypothetical protein
MFGSLQARKGLFEIVTALSHLSSQARAASAFVFAGRLDCKIEGAFKAKLAAVKHKCPDLRVTLDEGFAPQSQVPFYFLGCDCVLMPYAKCDHSSGIMGHAAQARKPVIGPSPGLLGRLIRMHHLGLTVPPLDSKSLASAMESVIDGQDGLDLSGVARFAAARSGEAFASHLFKATQLPLDEDQPLPRRA